MYNVLGKDLLPKGFCQKPEKLSKEDYKSALNVIKDNISKVEELKLRTICMTSSKTLAEFNCEILPSILQYSSDIDAIFDPKLIRFNCQYECDIVSPSADFVIFSGRRSNNFDGIAIAAFSRTAPIFVFKDNVNGNYAVGVMLKQQLIKYGEYVFETILNSKVGKAEDVTLIIPTCTHYVYPGFGTIPDYIRELAKKFPKISKVIIERNTETDDNLFGNDDEYNNVVVVW